MLLAYYINISPILYPQYLTIVGHQARLLFHLLPTMSDIKTQNNVSFVQQLNLKKEESVQLLKELNSSTEFKQLPAHTNSDFHVYSIDDPQRRAYKSVLFLPLPYSQVVQRIQNPALRAKLFTDLLEVSLVEVHGNTTIQIFVFELFWPLMNRQFILAFWSEVGTQQSIFIWRSCCYEISTADANLRAECQAMGIVVEQTQLGSNLTFTLQAKLGLAGDLLTRSFIHSQVEGLLRLGDELMKETQDTSKKSLKEKVEENK